MDEKVKVGLVGCGTQAQVVHLPLLRASKYVELVALCDPDVRKLNHLGARYGVKRHYVDFDDFKRDAEIQAVVVATPNYLHAPMAIACMEYGKDVLCEIPMALSAAEAREMQQVAVREKRKLVPCLNYRLRPDVGVLRKFVTSGELGSIYYTKAGWLRGRGAWGLTGWHADRLRAGGGAFMSLGAEILDFSLFLLDPIDPVSIIGAAHRREGSMNVEDSAFAMLRFERDLVLTIEVGWSLLREDDITYFNLFGSKGAALLNPIQINKEMHGHLVNVTPALESKNPLRASAEKQLELFLRAILFQEDLTVKPEDGILVNELIDAFYQSVAQRKEVYLPQRDSRED
jgi:predicted dehydrogenase